MRILVYPHDLNLGGSQLNAIELAAEISALGHECVVYGRPGALGARIAELGLEFIESPDPGRRPSARIVEDLRRLVRARGIDVVHGYEWPPGLEAGLVALREDGVAGVCTVMSMAVAPFLPTWLPLVVGTRQIAANERARGRTAVHLLEPPVDLEHNRIPAEGELAAFRERWQLDGRALVVCVGRLVSELKSEGVLTAIRVAGELAASSPFQLLLVGDGSARPAVEAAAQAVNDRVGSNTVVLTGELNDPRPAYAVADVSLGMGGSALRALAFAKPLVVQGERGFFETLAPDSVEQFRWQGWYGVGASAADGPARLAGQLVPLLADPDRRAELGRYGRELVEEYSLARAARHQVEIYTSALEANGRGLRAVPEVIRAGASFTAYYLSKRVARLLGRSRTDDFNARPVAAGNDASWSRRTRPTQAASGPQLRPIVYFPGVDWDAVAGTDQQLATALSKLRPVVWVDPPQSVWSAFRRGVRVRPVSQVGPRLIRLHAYSPPGVTRPGLRALGERIAVRQLRTYLRASGVDPYAVVATGTQPFLARFGAAGCPRILFATDDTVAAAGLWGMSGRRLDRDRELNLAAADLVLAVTAELAAVLQRGDRTAVVFPNGCDPDRYAAVQVTEIPADVLVEPPIAGVIGQFNERTDIGLLEAVRAAGIGLLLVGPRYFATADAAADFEQLVARPGVQWIDRVPAERVPRYAGALAVGLTPYRDNAFNRRSFPLKTLDYLAAGIPVVASRVAPVEGLDGRFVRLADSAEEFVTCVRELSRSDFSRAEIRRSVEPFRWQARAEALVRMIEERSG
jgi:glycosyltransferase involved in cell wall biosynthesis